MSAKVILQSCNITRKHSECSKACKMLFRNIKFINCTEIRQALLEMFLDPDHKPHQPQNLIFVSCLEAKPSKNY